MDWSREANALLTERWNAGVPILEIAEELGCSKSQAAGHARYLGLRSSAGSQRQANSAGMLEATKRARREGAQRAAAIKTAGKDWEGFVAQLQAGMAATQIRGPNLPAFPTFKNRVRDDPAFAARVAPYFSVRPSRPASPESAYQAVLAALRSGGHLSYLIEGPDQPTRAQWRAYVAAHPSFAAEVEAARRANGAKAHYSPGAWAQLLAEAANFTRLPALCAQPGMPTQAAVFARMGRDPAFDATIRSLLTFEARHADDEHIETAVRAIEEGAAFRAVVSMPNMPRAAALMRRLKSRPDLRERVLGKVRGLAAGGVKFRAEEYERALDLIREGKSPREMKALGLPAYATIEKYRRSNADFDAQLKAIMRHRRAADRKWSEPDFERALRAVQEGAAVGTLGAVGLPNKSAVAAQRRRDPRFDERWKLALVVYGGQTQREGAFALQRALSRNEVYGAVDRVVGRWLEPSTRDEIVSEMMLAVLDGTIGEDEITRETAALFVTAFHREEGTNSRTSLDETGGDGDLGLLDRIAAGGLSVDA